MLVEEGLVAGLGEHDEAENAVKCARGANCARSGGFGGGCECEGRESVDEVSRPFSVSHSEFCAGYAYCILSLAPTGYGR